MNAIAMPATTTTTTLAANIQHIPLSKLVPSKANVRRVKAPESDYVDDENAREAKKLAEHAAKIITLPVNTRELSNWP